MPVGHTFYHRDPPLNGESYRDFHQRMGRIHHDLIDAALWHKVWGWNMQNMPMPALPRPPLPNTAALIALMEAHLASRWVAIGSKKIPYDAPGPSMMERAWRKLRGQQPPQPTPTKAEP